MGSQEELKIQAAPLMSDIQRQFLDQYLTGVGNVMQGYTFGQAYPGAKSSGYNPMQFFLGSPGAGGLGPWGAGAGGVGGAGVRVDPGTNVRAAASLGDASISAEPGADVSADVSAVPLASAEPRPSVTARPQIPSAAEPTAEASAASPMAIPGARLSPSLFDPIGFTSNTIGEPAITSMLPFVLNNIPMNRQPPSNDQMLMQQLASIFASPYTHGLTGNFPKKTQ